MIPIEPSTGKRINARRKIPDLIFEQKLLWLNIIHQAQQQ